MSALLFAIAPIMTANPAAAACPGPSPSLGPTARWLGGYVQGSGATGSSSSWVTADLADDGNGTVSGAMTSLDGTPGNYAITGTLDCSGNVQGSIAWSYTINFQGVLSADGNTMTGNWQTPALGVSGTFSTGRVLRRFTQTSTNGLSTGSPATAAEPVQVNVQSPAAGNMDIETANTPNLVLSGYSILNQMVHIEAPTGTPTAPLVITFLLDTSALSQPVILNALDVFRNGTVVPKCTPGGSFSSDPCAEKTLDPMTGDVTITVRTTSASIWVFGQNPDWYNSTYSSAEARNLYIDAVRLHDSDLSSVQKKAALFMAYLGGLVGSNPPNLGPNPGAGPITVTSVYSSGEYTSVNQAATLFGTDPSSLQRIGINLLAYLFIISGG